MYLYMPYLTLPLFVLFDHWTGSAEYGSCPEQGVGRIAKPPQASHLEAGESDVCIEYTHELRCWLLVYSL